MTWELLLSALIRYGPGVIDAGMVIVKNIEAGRGQTQVTAADLLELQRLCSLTSADIDKREGVTLTK